MRQDVLVPSKSLVPSTGCLGPIIHIVNAAVLLLWRQVVERGSSRLALGEHCSRAREAVVVCPSVTRTAD